MLRKDCHKPYWKERFIDGLPPIFSHKVKQVLMGKNDSIDYNNLTYGDIFSAIKKLGINMCNDEKLLKYHLRHKKKAKYEMSNFCEPNVFYAKKKNVSKKYDKQMSGKGKCFNCGKPGHFSKDCNKKPGSDTIKGRRDTALEAEAQLYSDNIT